MWGAATRMGGLGCQVAGQAASQGGLTRVSQVLATTTQWWVLWARWTTLAPAACASRLTKPQRRRPSEPRPAPWFVCGTVAWHLPSASLSCTSTQCPCSGTVCAWSGT